MWRRFRPWTAQIRSWRALSASALPCQRFQNQVYLVCIHCTYPFISSFHFLPAFLIHLILTWIRIRILGSTFGKSGSGSGSSYPPFRNSGSGSSDPHLEKVDPNPVPKWIRIRVPIFHKEIHVGQIKMLIFITVKISQITKTFSFTYYSK